MKQIPYQCDRCIHGEWLPHDSCYEAGCHATTDEECLKNFKDKDKS